jgi:hypothetical protein
MRIRSTPGQVVAAIGSNTRYMEVANVSSAGVVNGNGGLCHDQGQACAPLAWNVSSAWNEWPIELARR